MSRTTDPLIDDSEPYASFITPSESTEPLTEAPGASKADGPLIRRGCDPPRWSYHSARLRPAGPIIWRGCDPLVLSSGETATRWSSHPARLRPAVPLIRRVCHPLVLSFGEAATRWSSHSARLRPAGPLARRDCDPLVSRSRRPIETSSASQQWRRIRTRLFPVIG